MNFKFIFSELKNNKKFALLFIVNFAIGLSGFLALDTFKNSLDESLKGQSKAILGADFGISARRKLTDREYQGLQSLLPPETEEAKIIETYSMVASKAQKTLLVQIKAIESRFPFYGYIELESAGKIFGSSKPNSLESGAKIWVYPEILPQLGVKVGDQIKIGDIDFTIEDTILNDSASGISTSMAPRVYMSFGSLLKTKLVREGSLAWYTRVFEIKNSNLNDLNNLRDAAFEGMNDAAVRVFTHENSSEQLGRVINYLNDFLGLTALAALFLSAIGGSFLFRNFLRQKIQQIAILVSLGMTHSQALFLNFLQVLVLGFLSSILALALSFSLLPALSSLISQIAPIDIQLTFKTTTVLVALILGTLACGLIALPLLVQLRKLKPSLLLNQGQSINLKWDAMSLLAGIPGLLVFWGLSIWQANSFKIGSLFVGLFFLAGIILGTVSIYVFKFLFSTVKTSSNSLRWGLRDLSRLKASTMTAFLSLGLGMLLLNLIPQIKASIQAEIDQPESSKVPSLFLFDIQEEQADPLKKILKSANIPLQQFSPMVRAKLITVNNEPFEKQNASESAATREEERENRFRNRGFNLSYRENLSSTESIVKGVPFSGIHSGDPDEVAEISMEFRFADRLGIKLGDVLTFDIQGIPISGKVINFRKVSWSTFQPNFFILFQPGILDMAPKTFVASLPRMKRDDIVAIQGALVDKLPNVSIIDVTRLVKRLQNIVTQMSSALTFMAYLCLMAGFVVLYSIANYQARIRSKEIGILKALGASFSNVRNLFLWQYCTLSFVAGLSGVLLSLSFSYVLSSFLFEGLWAFDLWTPIGTLVGSVLLTIVVTWFATQKSLQTPARKLF